MAVKKLSKMAQAARELFEFKAMDIGNLFRAFHSVKKANRERYMASGHHYDSEFEWLKYR